MSGTVRAALALGLALASAARAGDAPAQGDPVRGATAFRQCLPCHALQAGNHETGPSLAGIYGRAAGTAAGFDRYSPALAGARFDWTPERLDAWLENPSRMLPGSRMTWSVPDPGTRADLIAYLKALHDGNTDGLAIPQASVLDLKSLGRAGRVRGIRLCRDTFAVTLENGATLKVWDRNLRLRVDTSQDGPAPDAPALLPGGMHGDRYTVVFHAPGEISGFIGTGCD